MNVDRILDTLNRHRVAYILIGGMNFVFRHAPQATFDVDLWIDDTTENVSQCEKALGELQAQWGISEADWGAVADKPAGWLARQPIFCLTSPSGSIDIFRAVKGLESWAASRARACPGQTAAGTNFFGLSDEDMLKCQMALPENERKLDRIRLLNGATRGGA